jgi:hypothetical protein
VGALHIKVVTLLTITGQSDFDSLFWLVCSLTEAFMGALHIKVVTVLTNTGQSDFDNLFWLVC